MSSTICVPPCFKKTHSHGYLLTGLLLFYCLLAVEGLLMFIVNHCQFLLYALSVCGVCVCVCADQCHWPVRLHRRDSVSVPVEPEEMCSSAEPPPMQSAQSEAPHLHTHTHTHTHTHIPTYTNTHTHTTNNYKCKALMLTSSSDTFPQIQGHINAHSRHTW